MCIHTLATCYVCKSEDSLWKLLPTFHHLVFEDQMQVIRLGGKRLSPLTHPGCPYVYFLVIFVVVKQHLLYPKPELAAMNSVAMNCLIYMLLFVRGVCAHIYLGGVGFLHPPFWVFLGLTSGHQIVQATSPTEQSHQPDPGILICPSLTSTEITGMLTAHTPVSMVLKTEPRASRMGSQLCLLK